MATALINVLHEYFVIQSISLWQMANGEWHKQCRTQANAYGNEDSTI